MTTTVIERTKGHYEVHEVPYATDYAWHPPSVVLECDCGERIILTASMTRCRCGADHADLVQEKLLRRRAGVEVHVLLRDEHEAWLHKKAEYLHSEDNYRLELSRLE